MFGGMKMPVGSRKSSVAYNEAMTFLTYDLKLLLPTSHPTSFHSAPHFLDYVDHTISLLSNIGTKQASSKLSQAIIEKDGIPIAIQSCATPFIAFRCPSTCLPHLQLSHA